MKQTQWRIQAKKADFEAIGAEFGISPVTARLIRNRNVIGRESLPERRNRSALRSHASAGYGKGAFTLKAKN